MTRGVRPTCWYSAKHLFSREATRKKFMRWSRNEGPLASRFSKVLAEILLQFPFGVRNVFFAFRSIFVSAETGGSRLISGSRSFFQDARIGRDVCLSFDALRFRSNRCWNWFFFVCENIYYLYNTIWKTLSYCFNYIWRSCTFLTASIFSTHINHIGNISFL